MYRFGKSFLPLLSICLLFMFFGVAQLFPGTARADDGQIIFYGKGPQDDTQPGTVVCTLPLRTGEYNMENGDIKNCSNDDAHWYKLTNAPSATRLEFYDHPDCDQEKGQNFFFFLKTVKHNFTMEAPVHIDKIREVGNGNIVPGAPGLRLEYLWLSQNGDQIEGKLSCVRIIRSGVPEN